MNTQQLLADVQRAAGAGQLTVDAAKNLSAWLVEPQYAEYAPLVAQHIAEGQWQTLDDVFWTIIPFGTGGRRGKMYPIGSNAINDRTIGESAQGLADYMRDQALPGEPLGCAIAYDTRHRSRHFAELCAEIMTANSFSVFFLDGYRSTPELSFTVRHKQCACGIMVTASHNPPSDNAVKAYGANGGQLLPPHDRGVIERVMSTKLIARRPFAEALAAGKVVYCQQEIDAEYQRQVLAQSIPGPRNLKIVYSPMHGVGAAGIVPVLAADGFTQVEVFAPHAEPNGDFPNVPGHVSNPENPATFDGPIARAQEIGADVVLSTDPDADRLGCAAPLRHEDSLRRDGRWRTLSGNQIGALLADYVLEGRRAAGSLSADHYIITTLVTTELTRRIALSYGVKAFYQLHVGFKHIGGAIDDLGPEKFVFGTEESHGYLAGQYVRDKDGAVAAMLMAELAAKCKATGQTLHDKLDALNWQHGCHVEMPLSRTLPGSEGMAAIRQLMATLRDKTPATLGGLKVVRLRDYLDLTQRMPGGPSRPIEGPPGDMVMLDLEIEGNYVAVRPSGTEPKVKFYLFAYEPPELLADLETTKQELYDRLERISRDLSALE